MLSAIWAYICALFSNWAALFWGAGLVLDAGQFVLYKKDYVKITDWLDRRLGSENKRVLIFRSLFFIGLLIAGFNAWDEQYQLANSKSADASSISSKLANVEQELNQFQARDWPVLTSDEKTALIKAAKAMGQHSFLVTCGYAECDDLADDVYETLRKAGWSSPSDQPVDTVAAEGAVGLIIVAGKDRAHACVIGLRGG